MRLPRAAALRLAAGDRPPVGDLGSAPLEQTSHWVVAYVPGAGRDAPVQSASREAVRLALAAAVRASPARPASALARVIPRAAGSPGAASPISASLAAGSLAVAAA